MNRIKTIAMTVFSMILAIAALGFFATIGLALIGGLAAMGAVVAMIAGISTFFANKNDTLITPSPA